MANISIIVCMDMLFIVSMFNPCMTCQYYRAEEQSHHRARAGEAKGRHSESVVRIWREVWRGEGSNGQGWQILLFESNKKICWETLHIHSQIHDLYLYWTGGFGERLRGTSWATLFPERCGERVRWEIRCSERPRGQGERQVESQQPCPLKDSSYTSKF